MFTSNKTGPKWRAWYAMSEAEQQAKAEVGVAAVKAWDAAHRDVIVPDSRCAASGMTGAGRWGPTKRVSDVGITDVVNELTVFMVVRADSHEAAARIFEAHPHCTIFVCDAVEVMPLLGE